jgi:hypothetical protein
VRSREASELYRHKIVLVRPDQHVAWRGDAEPADPLDLVDLVRGAARTSMAKSAWAKEHIRRRGCPQGTRVSIKPSPP